MRSALAGKVGRDLEGGESRLANAGDLWTDVSPAVGQVSTFDLVAFIVLTSLCLRFVCLFVFALFCGTCLLG